VPTPVPREKLDNAVYTIRGYADLADLARTVGDSQTRRWAVGKAQALLEKFEEDWWYGGDADSYADSLDDPGNEKVFQRHWIGLPPLTPCCRRSLSADRRRSRRTNTRTPHSTNTRGTASQASWDSSIPAPGQPRLRLEILDRAATR
jgi:hypothetical protein